MFRTLRLLPETLQSLTNALNRVAGLIQENTQHLQDGGGLADRMDALDLGRAKWEAELEALVIKAQGQYRSAANAEERARTMKKRSDAGSSEGDLASEEEVLLAYRALGLVPEGNGEVSTLEELPALPPGVVARRLALRAKYGV